MRRPSPTVFALPAAAAVLLFSLPAGAELPPGALVSPAVAIDITEDGFDAIGETAPAIVPESIEIEQLVLGEGDIPPLEYETGGFTFTLQPQVQITSLSVGLELAELQFVPDDNELTVEAEMSASVNAPEAPVNIAAGFPVTIFGEDLSRLIDCDMYVEQFDVDVLTRVGAEIVEGDQGSELDITLGDLGYDTNLAGNDFNISNCFIGDVDEVFREFGFSVFDVVLPIVEGQIDDLLANSELTADLEASLETTFNSFAFDTSVALGDTEIAVSVAPSGVIISPDGMRVTLDGSSGALEPHPCVAGNGLDGSLQTPDGPPNLARALDGTRSGHHVAALIDDDFANQVLFGAYQSGALCLTLDAEDSGLPLNTGLLDLLAEGAFDEVFPEAASVVIDVSPTSPPLIRGKQGHDLGLAVEELQVDLYADVDYRKARVVGLALDAEAGIDFELDAETGQLGIGVSVEPEDLAASTRMNLFAPGFDNDLADGVSNLFDQLVAPLLGGLLSDFGFTLPAFGRAGLVAVGGLEGGSDGTWVGIAADVGEVAYADPEAPPVGCASDGADEALGGCVSVPGLPVGLVLVTPLVFALRRRRHVSGS